MSVEVESDEEAGDGEEEVEEGWQEGGRGRVDDFDWRRKEKGGEGDELEPRRRRGRKAAAKKRTEDEPSGSC